MPIPHLWTSHENAHSASTKEPNNTNVADVYIWHLQLYIFHKLFSLFLFYYDFYFLFHFNFFLVFLLLFFIFFDFSSRLFSFFHKKIEIKLKMPDLFQCFQIVSMVSILFFLFFLLFNTATKFFFLFLFFSCNVTMFQTFYGFELYTFI